MRLWNLAELYFCKIRFSIDSLTLEKIKLNWMIFLITECPLSLKDITRLVLVRQLGSRYFDVVPGFRIPRSLAHHLNKIWMVQFFTNRAVSYDHSWNVDAVKRVCICFRVPNAIARILKWYNAWILWTHVIICV